MNSINFDQIDPAIDEIAGEEKKENSESEREEFEEKKQFANDYQIDAYVYQIEKLAFSWLKQKHEKLAVSDDDIKTNAEMLSTVLQKNFSVDVLKNSPELMWVGHTVILAAQLGKVYTELKNQGEI